MPGCILTMIYRASMARGLEVWVSLLGKERVYQAAGISADLEGCVRAMADIYIC